MFVPLRRPGFSARVSCFVSGSSCFLLLFLVVWSAPFVVGLVWCLWVVLFRLLRVVCPRGPVSLCWGCRGRGVSVASPLVPLPRWCVRVLLLCVALLVPLRDDLPLTKDRCPKRWVSNVVSLVA